MKTRNYWIVGTLGLLVVLFNYLGFTAPVKSAFMIAFGLVISFLAFREVAREKLDARETQDADEDEAGAFKGSGEASIPEEKQVKVRFEEI
ncbi:hypothetical protein C4572_02620 [Candidatus Parcubacteria bacterium]|nr:MAG: hypothetical protein C4572_02620 [Candidatus Parcubacteria bacterium]